MLSILPDMTLGGIGTPLSRLNRYINDVIMTYHKYMTYVHVTEIGGAPPVSKLQTRTTSLPAVTGPYTILVTITFNSKSNIIIQIVTTPTYYYLM